MTGLLLTIYGIDLLDKLQGLTGPLAIAGIVSIAVYGVQCVIAAEHRTKSPTTTTLKWGVRLAIVATLVYAFIPSKETTHAMLAVYGVSELAQTEVASKSMEVLEAYLEKELGSLKESIVEEITDE